MVAVGAQRFHHAEDWNAIRFADHDAEAFFDWAQRTSPAHGDATVIRELIVGEEATDDRVGQVLSRIMNRDGAGSVRPGDTILFYFAGPWAEG